MRDRKQPRTQHRSAIDDLRRAVAKDQARRHQVGCMRRSAGIGGLAAETPSAVHRGYLRGHRIERTGAHATPIAVDLLERRARKVASEQRTARTNRQIPSDRSVDARNFLAQPQLIGDRQVGAAHLARDENSKHPRFVESIRHLARHLRLALGAIGMLANYRRKPLHLLEIWSCAFG